jgi:hypothetical protein
MAVVFVMALTADNLVSAQPVTFTGSNSGNQLAASVTFNAIGGGDLQVTLTDTYTGDTVDQAHVLTGVFFSGATGLTPVSATAGPGSLEWSGKSSSAPESSSVLGTEWAYATATGAPNGAASGIVSAGYWSPAGPGFGNFSSLPGDMLDGTPYGLLSAGYAGSDKDGLSNRAYIQDSMVFVLSGFSGSLTSTTISDVSFQYGSALNDPTEPNLVGMPLTSPAPEPSVMAYTAIAGAAILAEARRRAGKRTSMR